MESALKIVGFSTTPSRRKPEISLKKEPASATWQAFQAGMEVLQRFANHAAIDVDAISRSNLQLLHRTLSRDAAYHTQIEQLQSEAKTSSLPIIRRLYTDQSMIADLVLVQAGSQINLPALPQTGTMYLLISGSAELVSYEKSQEIAQHWWQKFGIGNANNTLRNGAVIIPSTNKPPEKLRSATKQCLLLRVNTLSLEVECEAAS